MTNAAAAKSAKPARQHGFLAETVEIVKTVFYALLIALVLRVVLFQPYTIPSASEEPNLYRGDYIIVSKWSYGWSQKSVPFLDLVQPIVHGRLLFRSPKRGDIIVFALPHDGHTNFIKRLIGLPGDRIQMRAGRLYINGAPVKSAPAPLPDPPAGIPEEGYKGQLETDPEGKRYLTQVNASAETGIDPASSAANTGVFLVPPHCYFMMGDNRDDSLDSRFNPLLSDDDPKLGGCGVSDAAINGSEPGVGFVPEENLIGKAQLVLISWNTGTDNDPCCASLFKPWTWFTDVRLNRMFKLLR
jgi:signal peptidase I